MSDPGRVFQALKFGAGGLAGLAVGTWLVVNPGLGLASEFRPDPVPSTTTRRASEPSESAS